MSRALFAELREVVPVSVGAEGAVPVLVWAFGHRDMLSPFALLFWSEQSERSVLTSWSALLGFKTEDRDFLGRWR
eukprot:11082021-Heterocapsa_arctica.AAC.1